MANEGADISMGSGLGAAIGSVIPGVGTLIGGAVGALGGLVASLFGGKQTYHSTLYGGSPEFDTPQQVYQWEAAQNAKIVAQGQIDLSMMTPQQRAGAYRAAAVLAQPFQRIFSGGAIPGAGYSRGGQQPTPSLNSAMPGGARVYGTAGARRVRRTRRRRSY